MSLGTVAQVEARFKQEIKEMVVRLENNYELELSRQASDYDKIDFCISLLEIYPTHREAGRWLVPKVIKTLETINNNALNTLMKDEVGYRQVNMILQMSFIQRVIRCSNGLSKANWVPYPDLKIQSTDIVIDTDFHFTVFIDALVQFLKGEDNK